MIKQPEHLDFNGSQRKNAFSLSNLQHMYITAPAIFSAFSFEM